MSELEFVALVLAAIGPLLALAKRSHPAMAAFRFTAEAAF